jgi:replication factor C subunit 3/5
MTDLNDMEKTDEHILTVRETRLLPWAEKYRPVSIDGLVYHEKITKSIINYLSVGKLPHLLFYGPPGSGKTTLMLAIAKQYYKSDFENMIMVLNASEERGIETVRDKIIKFAKNSGLSEEIGTPPFKLIILDEIDAMTDDAQAILRKVIEKYVNNVRFCFICNYLKKINPAIQSRCVIFRFNPIPRIEMYEYVKKICNNENMKITKNAIELIIKRTNGDMRKLLNILQSLHMHNFMLGESVLINENSVSKILSCPTQKNIIDILEFLQSNNLKNSYEFILAIIQKNGISLLELINNIYEYMMDFLINDNPIIKYDKATVINIIKNLAIINVNLSYCNNENIQLYSFVAIFYM